jgi:hypothetical protein
MRVAELRSLVGRAPLHPTLRSQRATTDPVFVFGAYGDVEPTARDLAASPPSHAQLVQMIVPVTVPVSENPGAGDAEMSHEAGPEVPPLTR